MDLVTLTGIEIWPKSYACNCQTPGAFDRFFMPFDVTFEKIQSENGNYWNSVESQSLAESSKTSTSPNSLKTARLFDKTSSTCQVDLPGLASQEKYYSVLQKIQFLGMNFNFRSVFDQIFKVPFIAMKHRFIFRTNQRPK